MARRRSWKPTEKQRQNRIERFISKYGYDPRSSYRPNRTGVRGRPEKEYQYDRNLVKSANERLRKIEKVYGLAEDSNEYKLVRKYAIEYPRSKGKIYKVSDNMDSVRFISEKEYNKLSKKEKKYFNETLANFLKSTTSTKSGIESKYSKSYNTFMEHYGDKYPDLSMEQYKDFFRTYRDLANRDKQNQFDYNTLVQTLEFIDIGEALNQNQLEKAMRYIATNRFHKIPKKFRLRT